MGKSLEEKQELVSFFFDIDDKPNLIDPHDFLFLSENGIFDTQRLLEMEEKIEKLLEGGCFVIIDENTVNACAMQKDGIPIIALYSEAIIKILYDANLLMLSDEFLPEVGDLGACLHDVRAKDYPMAITENSMIRMTYSGDPTRELLGYIIASLAIRFIIYHEVGHHKNGDLQKLKEKYNILFYNEKSVETNGAEYADDRKMMEFQADTFALDMIVSEADDLLKCWSDILEIELTYSELFQLMIPAFILVKENLPVEIYVPDYFEKSFYLPGIIRVSLGMYILSMQEPVKEILYLHISELLKDSNLQEQLKQVYGFQPFDNNGSLTEMGYNQFCSIMIANMEHIYCSIFIGEHYQRTLIKDIKAGDWFVHLYK